MAAFDGGHRSFVPWYKKWMCALALLLGVAGQCVGSSMILCQLRCCLKESPLVVMLEAGGRKRTSTE